MVCIESVNERKKMTGTELVKSLRAAKNCKVYAFVATAHDGTYLPIEKAQLIAWCMGCGESETGMKLNFLDGAIYFDIE